MAAEAEEFRLADQRLRQDVPSLSRDEVGHADPWTLPSMYLCDGQVYATRTVCLACEQGRKLEVRSCDRADEAPDLGQTTASRLSPTQLMVRSSYWRSGCQSSGLKAWDASILFARWLYRQRSLLSGITACELGAGSAAVPGMAASLACREVYLTDRGRSVIDDLLHNVRGNAAGPRGLLGGRTCKVMELDWGCPSPSVPPVDVVLGSEVLYDAMDVGALVRTLLGLLKQPHGVAYVAAVEEGRGDTIDHFVEEVSIRGLCVAKQRLEVQQLTFDSEDMRQFASLPDEGVLLVTVSWPTLRCE